MWPEVLTPAEAAAYLRVSLVTLSRRRRRGEAPRFTKIGKTVRYAKRDLDEFLSAESNR